MQQDKLFCCKFILMEALCFEKTLLTGCLDYVERTSKITYGKVAPLITCKKIIRQIDRNNVPDSLYLSVNDFNSRQYSFYLSSDKIYSNQSLLGELSQNQIVISRDFEREISNYLVDEYNEAKSKQYIEYQHSSLGWSDIDGKQVFLLDKNQIGEKLSAYVDSEFRFTNGSRAVYTQFLKDVVFPCPTLSLALCIGYSAVVISRLKNIANTGTIIVNFCGSSSTGKTTAEELLVSPFGCPAETNSKGFVHTFHATTNALFAFLSGVNGIPVVFDDITTNPNIDKTNLLYTIATGEGKARCNAEGNIREAFSNWSGVVVISSETPILDDAVANQGLLARVLSTDGITWTPDAETADTIKRTVRENYGFTGRDFAEFVGKLELSELKERYLKAKMQTRAMMRNRDNLSERLEAKYACFYLTFELVNECFSLSLDSEKLMSILLNPEQNGVSERDISVKALDAIKDLIYTKRAHFNVLELVHTPKPHMVDIISPKGDKYGTIKQYDNFKEVYISAKLFNETLKNNGITEVSTVKSRLVAKNIIQKHDKGRFDCKYDGIRCICLTLPIEKDTVIDGDNQPISNDNQTVIHKTLEDVPPQDLTDEEFGNIWSSIVGDEG